MVVGWWQAGRHMVAGWASRGSGLGITWWQAGCHMVREDSIVAEALGVGSVATVRGHKEDRMVRQVELCPQEAGS